MKNIESQKTPSRQCPITSIEKADLEVTVQITEKDSNPNCM